MDTLIWISVIVIISLAVILFLLAFTKLKSELDILKETIRSNNELNKKNIAIINKEIALLNSSSNITNERLQSCNLRLDNTAQTIEILEKQIEDNQKQVLQKHNELSEVIKTNNITFANEIAELVASIIEIKKTNKELRNKLSIFTEIDEDSKNLSTNDINHIETTQKSSPEELNSEIELDAEQKTVFDLMMNSNTNLFVTGKAGTGKSFLLKYFVNELTKEIELDEGELDTRKKVLVLAPTGISALNAGGVTIHSAFGWNNLRLDNESLVYKNIMLKSEKRQVLKNVQTIIIDEISMVRVDILEKIDKILKIINENSSPFGGKQMLLFGDLYQLPPIANEKELKYLKDTFGGKYFFCSKAYKKGKFDFFELTINHRQKDDAAFFEILNNIREGNISDEDLRILNARTKFNNEELRRVVELFPHKGKVESINQKELDKIPAREYVFRSKVTYRKNDLTFDIEKITPVSETLKLKLGALVMMVKNDENNRWVNGTLAIVSYINQNCIKVKIDGYEYEVLPTSFTQHETVYEEGKIKYEPIFSVEQYPIVLAYAITIHKSQGMTYKKIACDVTNCFEPGQAYVALSRCISIDALYLLEPVDRKMLGVESEILDFYKREKAKSKAH